MSKFLIFIISLLFLVFSSGCDSKDLIEKNVSLKKVTELQKSEYKVVYNGNTLEQLEILQNKSKDLYISCKQFVLMMDGKAKWDKELKSVNFDLNNKVFTLKANDKYATIDGKQVEMEGLNILSEEDLLSSLNFLVNAADLQYQKDENPKIIRLSSKQSIKLDKASNLKEDIVPINKEIKLKN